VVEGEGEKWRGGISEDRLRRLGRFLEVELLMLPLCMRLTWALQNFTMWAFTKKCIWFGAQLRRASGALKIEAWKGSA